MNKKAFSLLELIVVIAIVSLFSTLAFFSFTTSSYNLTLKSNLEVLNDQLLNLKNDILYANFEKISIDFSVKHPRFYWKYNDNYLINDQESFLATNFRVTDTTPTSYLIEGQVLFDWDNPIDTTAKTSLKIESLTKTLYTFPTDPLDTLSSPHLFQGLDEVQNYVFKIINPENKQFSSSISLNYFSYNNFSTNSEDLTLLKKIELKNFNNNWVSVDDLKIKIIKPRGKMKFFANGQEFKDCRLTFNLYEEEQILKL